MISVDLGQIIQEINNRRKRVKYEFQELGLMLASKLNDPRHKALYMKLAKYEEQELLMDALHYVLASPSTSGNVGALFMWKLKELKARPIEPIKLRFVIGEGGYYIVGGIKNALRGDLPVLLAALREYCQQYPEEIIYAGTRLEFPHFSDTVSPLLKKFAVKAQVLFNTQWTWKGEGVEPKEGAGEFMFDKPVLTKLKYTRRIPAV